MYIAALSSPGPVYRTCWVLKFIRCSSKISSVVLSDFPRFCRIWGIASYMIDRCDTKFRQFDFSLSPLLVTMCYLDIHPANILLAFFRLHPLENRSRAYLNISPGLEKSSRRLQNSKWTNSVDCGTVARSSRPQELFRNWRSGLLVIPRTGSVGAHARKTHARLRTLLLTWDKHKMAFYENTHAFVKQDPPTCKDSLLHTRNICCPSLLFKETSRLHVSTDKCGAEEQILGRAPWEWCHGRCCWPQAGLGGYS